MTTTQPNLGDELSKLRIDKARKRPPRRGPRWLLLVLALLGAGLGYKFYAQAHAAVPVKVAKPAREIDTGQGTPVLTAGGYVIPRHKVEVSSKIVGRVKELLVKRGDQVKEGDVLLRIEDDEYQAQVRAATAQLASIRAKLTELRTGSRPEEIEAARAAVASAEATLKGTKQDLDRLEELGREEVISRQELDRIRTQYGVAKANLESARKNAELVKIGPRQEQITAAEAQEREAQANLEYARTQLAFTVIRAPITGTILEKLAEKGELVTNINFGGTRGAKSSVVSMANLNDLQVEIDLNENDLGKVHLHQRCAIRVDSAPEEIYKGEVDEIAPAADRQKATVQVKVRVLNPNEAVRPEVNARVTFLKEPKAGNGNPRPRAAGQARIWIPRAALVSGADGASFVFVADGDKAVRRAVKLGDEGEKGIEVVDGLTGAETLIVEPLDKIRDGARIEVAS